MAELPEVSVLICFFNEAFSVLIRTVASVIERTPSHLLREIILMDDYSDKEDAFDERMDKFLNSPLGKLVKVHRNLKREGLIRSRVKAARLATGAVVVFLDSHCEVNTNWLPPLLHELHQNANTVVCPVIDMINEHDFMYQGSNMVKGGFNWGLHFSWDMLPQNYFRDSQNEVKPISSPTMAGGLFAISRHFFFHLGAYDENLEIWGGENLELSFKIWMCGGSLKIVPCSRVGHVFRSQRPYGSAKDTMGLNSARVAEVWLDEHKKHFYALRPDLVNRNIGDISSRVELRHQLKCKSFDWYLQDVYPELEIPGVRAGSRLLSPWQFPTSVIVSQGKIYNFGNNECLDAAASPAQRKGKVVTRDCKRLFSQYWTINNIGEVKVKDKLCLDEADVGNNRITRMMKCHEQRGGQLWNYNHIIRRLYNSAAGLCLAAPLPQEVLARLIICNEHDPFQQWEIIS